ncbi:MAG: PQQ-binding-like beta-propeller repeat protein [Verrucomicrobiota bacterium]
MKSQLSILAILILFQQLLAAEGDWPNWRGPNFNNVAPAGSSMPAEFGPDKNLVWKTDIPGRGHSSPIVVGDRLIVTTADEAKEVQSVICLSRDSGEQLWKTDVHTGNFVKRIHKKNTHASPTPAWDGERIIVSFFNGGMVNLTALNIEGEKLWSTQPGAYRGQYNYGYAASPLIHGDNVIVVSEFKEDGFLAAFNRADGSEVWRVPRSNETSYSSPILAKSGGKEIVVISGDDKLTAYNPENGEQIWATAGVARATSGTATWDGDLVFASGGYPQKETLAVNAKTGEAVWRNTDKSYEQSLLAHDGYVYTLNDAGIANCWRASDGKQMWQERLGGPVSASPVLVGDLILATNERGQFFVFKANPQSFELVSQTTLGNESFASPAVSGDRIFIRVAGGRDRQETIYCFGK